MRPLVPQEIQRASLTVPRGFSALLVAPDGKPASSHWRPALDVCVVSLLFFFSRDDVEKASQVWAAVSFDKGARVHRLGVLTMFQSIVVHDLRRAPDAGMQGVGVALPIPILLRVNDPLTLSLTNEGTEAMLVNPDCEFLPEPPRVLS